MLQTVYRLQYKFTLILGVLEKSGETKDLAAGDGPYNLPQLFLC